MKQIHQKLTFIKNSTKVVRNNKGKKIMFAEYSCECGNTATRRKADVTRDRIKSCGNCNGHKMSNTRFYKIYRAIKTRTRNPNYFQYHLYGGAGIKLEWDNFEDYKEDMFESYTEHVKQFGIKDTQIDRIDSKGNYSKENCRWATMKEQQNNKPNLTVVKYQGVETTVAEIARLERRPYTTVYTRYKSGYYN